MALTKSICDFAWKAPDFALKGVDGKTYTLADVRGPKGTLIVFICNHLSVCEGEYRPHRCGGQGAT